MNKTIITTGIILAVIAMVAIVPTVQAFSIDSDIASTSTDTTYTGGALFKMDNVTITGLDPKIKTAELKDISGTSPTMTIYPTYVSYNGKIFYSVKPNETMITGLYFAPDIYKIVKGATATLYFKDKLSPVTGFAKVHYESKGSYSIVGTIHIEGIPVPSEML